jgi:hypothetical protein
MVLTTQPNTQSDSTPTFLQELLHPYSQSRAYQNWHVGQVSGSETRICPDPRQLGSASTWLNLGLRGCKPGIAKAGETHR